MKETPFVMNNIAAGLEQFDLGKRETGHSKDELMENFSQIEQQQKKYGIVEYRMDSKKIYLESSRKERIVIPKIDIEYSIGWGPQKRGEPVNTKNENNKD